MLLSMRVMRWLIILLRMREWKLGVMSGAEMMGRRLPLDHNSVIGSWYLEDPSNETRLLGRQNPGPEQLPLMAVGPGSRKRRKARR